MVQLREIITSKGGIQSESKKKQQDKRLRDGKLIPEGNVSELVSE